MTYGVAELTVGWSDASLDPEYCKELCGEKAADLGCGTGYPSSGGRGPPHCVCPSCLLLLHLVSQWRFFRGWLLSGAPLSAKRLLGLRNHASVSFPLS